MLFRSNDTATTEIYTLFLHDALPISKAQELGLPILDGDGFRKLLAGEGTEG